MQILCKNASLPTSKASNVNELLEKHEIDDSFYIYLQANSTVWLARFKVGGKWGAISKTNYACLRWRDPVYRSVRELAMSYFHEYAKGPRKTLRSHSVPFDLRKMGDDGWIAGEGNRWDVTLRITGIRHMAIVTDREARALRPRDAVEVATDRITAFPIPSWKRQRL